MEGNLCTWVRVYKWKRNDVRGEVQYWRGGEGSKGNKHSVQDQRAESTTFRSLVGGGGLLLNDNDKDNILMKGNETVLLAGDWCTMKEL